MNIDGTDLRFIDKAEYYCSSPDWSSDDSRIIYSKYIDETPGDYSPPLYIDPTNDVAVFDFSSEEIKVLTDTLNNIYPKFTPDERIAYICTTETSMDIYVMNTDGKIVIYQSDIDSGLPEIWSMNSDGTNKSRLTNSYRNNENPISKRAGDECFPPYIYKRILINKQIIPEILLLYT